VGKESARERLVGLVQQVEAALPASARGFNRTRFSYFCSGYPGSFLYKNDKITRQKLEKKIVYEETFS
jgi:hypothetical protein